MDIITGLGAVPAAARGASIAIGNFDGVHRGHVAVIDAAGAAARRRGAALAVMTFEPHPRSLFAPDAPPFRLTPAPMKARLLADAGVDVLFEVPFDADFAAHEAQAFAQRILGETLGAAHVTAGSDFRFGKGRAGAMDDLARWGADAGFGVTALSPQGEGETAFSSSAARTALREGRPGDAAAILGRPHAIDGIVREGDRRGRTIGFPTVNLSLDGLLAPAFGVYAVTVDRRDAPGAWRGVANLGMRPTFNKAVPVLEAHLFDHAGDLYGAALTVHLHAFLRPERRFDGIEALKAQIARDVARAQTTLDQATI